MSDEELRGVVLAGGTGSRLFPLTKVTNKHLLPIGREPMIFYPVKKLIEAGIREILIVTGTEHMGDVVEPARERQGVRLRVHLPRAGRGGRHRPGARAGAALRRAAGGWR